MQLVTKGDIFEIKTEIANVRNEIKALENTFIKWLVASQIALIAVLVSILPLLIK